VQQSLFILHSVHRTLQKINHPSPGSKSSPNATHAQLLPFLNHKLASSFSHKPLFIFESANPFPIHSEPLTHPSYRQRELLSLQNLRIINPEEIRVQHRLYTSRKNRNPIPMSLRPIPPDPIRNIQRSVTAQRKQIMGSNRFRLASPLQ
jgi:hypothetical protein